MNEDDVGGRERARRGEERAPRGSDVLNRDAVMQIGRVDGFENCVLKFDILYSKSGAISASLLVDFDNNVVGRLQLIR